MKFTVEQLGGVASAIVESIRGEALPQEAETGLHAELAGANAARRREIEAGVREGLRQLMNEVHLWFPALRQKIDATLVARGLPSIDDVLAELGD